jgi:FkbH-like protein
MRPSGERNVHPFLASPIMPLQDVLEQHLASEHAAPARRAAAFATLTTALKDGLKEGRFDEVGDALRRAILPTLDLASLQTLRRIVEKLPRVEEPLKLAVLGGFTTDQLVQGIEVFLFACGIDVKVYSPEYDTFRQEILDPGSGLYRFAPSIVYLATGRRNLAHLPAVGETARSVAERIQREFSEWSILWRTLHERLGCQVVQNNFEPSPWRILGNREMSPSGNGGYICRLNLALQDGAPPFVTIHDVDALSAHAGRQNWSGGRYFHVAKLPCAPPFLVDYAHSVASVVAALRGKSRKCLVLDLDNTLWGGVVGDDGLAGLRLGQGDAESEAYTAFQEYALGLSKRGVLLAVCSKNTDGVAREVFEKHPGMRLKLSDIACFVANWEDKATNLRTIAKTLNIGLDACVFVDDSAAERSIVRQFAAGVAVPEMPADPADYIPAIERRRYFQLTALTKEDLERTAHFSAEASRKEVEQSSTDLASFLRSLSMVAQVSPIGPVTLERTVQLINKSNQYNLTTRRYSNADVLTILDDPRWVTRTVTLTDKFGDCGLISVVIAKVDGEDLRIDTWLMSCRVLKRSVEQHLLNHLVSLAQGRSLRRICGDYVPTPKNALVRDHYERLGFRCVCEQPDGRSSWELIVERSWSPLPSFIEATEEIS